MQSNALAQSPSRALVIAANAALTKSIPPLLTQTDWQVEVYRSFEQFQHQPQRPDCALIIVTDEASCAPQRLLAALKHQHASAAPTVVIVSGQPTAEALLQYRLAGAKHYLAAPVDPLRLLTISEEIKSCARYAAEAAPFTDATQTLVAPATIKAMIGNAPATLTLANQLADVALVSDQPVLLLGETGVGKEVAAQHIHHLSGRSGPFCPINCAATVEELIESELFGHEKGSFSGAAAMKKGLWEMAAGGTLFLDEITEAVPTMQTKLLRALQENRIRRVGANAEIPVTARIIAASNRDPATAVKENFFRADLLYRLGGIVRIPPLRARLDDIPLLVQHFAEAIAAQRRQPLFVTPEALAVLRAHPWPGNVRELESTLQQLAAKHGQIILPEHVTQHLHLQSAIPQALCDAWWATLHSHNPRDWPSARQARNDYFVRALLVLGKPAAVAHYLKTDIRTVTKGLAEAAEGYPMVRALLNGKSEAEP